MTDNGDASPTRHAESFLTPASFIKAAQRAHPAFRYALVVAGLAAIVVVFSKFGVGYPTLVFGVIVIVALMVLFLIFAQAATLVRSRLELPAQILVWAILVPVLLAISLLTSSTFFNQPLPLKDWIVQRLGTEKPQVAVPPSPTQQESPAAAVVKPGEVAASAISPAPPAAIGANSTSPPASGPPPAVKPADDISTDAVAAELQANPPARQYTKNQFARGYLTYSQFLVTGLDMLVNGTFAYEQGDGTGWPPASAPVASVDDYFCRKNSKTAALLQQNVRITVTMNVVRGPNSNSFNFAVSCDPGTSKEGPVIQ